MNKEPSMKITKEAVTDIYKMIINNQELTIGLIINNISYDVKVKCDQDTNVVNLYVLDKKQ